MFTVFANMRINSDERLQHMKESFESFYEEPDDWLINVRGSKRDEAIAFLKERLGNRATFFSLLDDSRGWITNAREMISHAKHDVIMFWLEDHINISAKGTLQKAAADMHANHVEWLLYSWWNVDWKLKNGPLRSLLKLRSEGTIEWTDLDRAMWRDVLSSGEAPFLLSIVSFFDKQFFLKLLAHDRLKLPYAYTRFVYRLLTFLQRVGFRFDQKIAFSRLNAMARHVFRRFPKETPFDLEKPPDRFDMLPMRVGFPLRELFVCIDDDADPKVHGYSLVSRGEYPLTERLIVWDPTRSLTTHVAKNMHLDQGKSITERYCYYGIKNVRSTPVREHIHVLRGALRIVCGEDMLVLEAGQGAAFYTNIPHSITALTDTEFVRYMPQTGLAPHYFSA